MAKNTTPETEQTALTVLQQHNFELVPLDENVKAIIAEELGDLGPIPFDVVKIPSGGSLMFELPGEAEDQPKMVQDLTGIILDHHPVNAYWKDAFTGEGAKPDCSSFDGKCGVNTDGEIIDCKSCPFNQFGSDQQGGKGKACKNMRRVYILPSGQSLPLLLVLPPSSLQAFTNYLAKRVVMKGKRPSQVLTKITLKREKNSGGIVYSQAVFTKEGDLSPQECEYTAAMAEAVKVMARSELMTSADSLQGSYDTGEAPEGFTPGDNIPF